MGIIVYPRYETIRSDIQRVRKDAYATKAKIPLLCNANATKNRKHGIGIGVLPFVRMRIMTVTK